LSVNQDLDHYSAWPKVADAVIKAHGRTKKAHKALPNVPEIARVRCPCRSLRFGSVRIGLRVYVRWCYRTIVYGSHT